MSGNDVKAHVAAFEKRAFRPSEDASAKGGTPIQGGREGPMEDARALGIGRTPGRTRGPQGGREGHREDASAKGGTFILPIPACLRYITLELQSDSCFMLTEMI